MLVRMTGDISGTRDGVRWPARGETVELPDQEAASLIAIGMAKAVERARSEDADVAQELPGGFKADEQATAEPTGGKRPARRKA